MTKVYLHRKHFIKAFPAVRLNLGENVGGADTTLGWVGGDGVGVGGGVGGGGEQWAQRWNYAKNEKHMYSMVL